MNVLESFSLLNKNSHSQLLKLIESDHLMNSQLDTSNEVTKSSIPDDAQCDPRL